MRPLIGSNFKSLASESSADDPGTLQVATRNRPKISNTRGVSYNINIWITGFDAKDEDEQGSITSDTLCKRDGSIECFTKSYISLPFGIHRVWECREEAQLKAF